ncbi:luciferin-binding protein-like [Lingula anatina]|uniref:Luciferin-binding protein-like n=1 Tax=Lingula anatina TaxID=7574 RepID=A0A1S3H270_LINAN|nr:luciferin-binding protein-like [Lingula anatina]|eukprot:XP_013379571.1 luciferin-binding protein-like [Lingula anatina]
MWFRIMDTNNDGLVYKEEYVDEVAKRGQQVLSPWRANAFSLPFVATQSGRILLRVIDVNNDGLVYKEEFMDEVAFRAQRVLSSWRAKAVYGLMKTVENCDEAMSVSEYSNLLEITRNVLPPGELFNIIDHSRNDIISMEEFLYGYVDCDEELSADEYSNFLHITRNVLPPEELFNAIDRNQNHIISLDEFLFVCGDFYFGMKDTKTALFYGSPGN